MCNASPSPSPHPAHGARPPSPLASPRSCWCPSPAAPPAGAPPAAPHPSHPSSTRPAADLKRRQEGQPQQLRGCGPLQALQCSNAMPPALLLPQPPRQRPFWGRPSPARPSAAHVPRACLRYDCSGTGRKSVWYSSAFSQLQGEVGWVRGWAGEWAASVASVAGSRRKASARQAGRRAVPVPHPLNVDALLTRPPCPRWAAWPTCPPPEGAGQRRWTHGCRPGAWRMVCTTAPVWGAAEPAGTLHATLHDLSPPSPAAPPAESRRFRRRTRPQHTCSGVWGCGVAGPGAEAVVQGTARRGGAPGQTCLRPRTCQHPLPGAAALYPSVLPCARAPQP